MSGLSVVRPAEVIGLDAHAFFVNEITRHYINTVKSIVKMGQLLIAAKAQLPHGEFVEMISTELPFKDRKAQTLMCIARHPVLANPQHVAALPASWGTLAVLERIPPQQLEPMIENGRVNAGTTRSDANRVLRERRRTVEAEAAAAGRPAPSRGAGKRSVVDQVRAAVTRLFKQIEELDESLEPGAEGKSECSTAFSALDRLLYDLRTDEERAKEKEAKRRARRRRKEQMVDAEVEAMKVRAREHEVAR